MPSLKYLIDTIKPLAIGLLLLIALGSCRGTKKMPASQQLFSGFTVNFKTTGDVDGKSKAKDELDAVIIPKPYPATLGLRPQLWLYYVLQTPKDKGVKHWLQRKLGKAPVLYENINNDKIANLMRNRLYNRGFFDITIEYQEETHHPKETTVTYNVKVGTQYRINKISYRDSNGRPPAVRMIARAAVKGVLKPKDAYNLGALDVQRQLTAEQAQHDGYFYFSPDYVSYQVDSSLRKSQLDIEIKLKPEAPAKALKPYMMGHIYINPTYAIDTINATGSDTTYFKQLAFTHPQNKQNYLRKKVFNRSIFFRTFELYSTEKHQQTLTRLNGLGTFKFVNLEFTPRDSAGADFLDLNVNLAPAKRKSISTEFTALTKSNNFTGPGVRLSFKNRNAFHGAEMLTFGLHAGFETQLSGQLRGLNSYDLGADVTLAVPRFILPFHYRYSSSTYKPFTKFRLGYSLLNRVTYYQFNSFNFSYGYAWQEDTRKEHILNPVVLNIVDVSKKYANFDTLVNRNPFLKRSFEQQFIIGSGYTFTYTGQNANKVGNNYYFQGNVDLSGNLAYGINQIIAPRTIDSVKSTTGGTNPYTVFGLPFSQYAKVDIDARYYYTFNPKTKQLFAARFIAGIGVPMGNSNTMPFIKQFFIGGNNSIRAFQIRSLGPGTYKPQNQQSSSFFFDQTGDIKLELNTEYRFPIISVLKGALFLDMGNVWLVSDEVSRPGGKFIASQVLNQLAVGAGFGFRIDINFFVLRLDTGLPLRKPYLPDGHRWLNTDAGFMGPKWIADNAVLNIAIGYPF